jgi:hypothetical protein
VTNCNRLKFEAADDKYYLTDAANAETLLDNWVKIAKYWGEIGVRSGILESKIGFVFSR